MKFPNQRKRRRQTLPTNVVTSGSDQPNDGSTTPPEAAPPPNDIVRLPPEAVTRIARAGVDPNDPRIQSVIAIATAYGGPIPSPEMLNAYRSVHPDLPEKIVQWTEVQMAHRHALENASAHGSERRMNMGQVFTFAGAIIGLTLAAGVGVAGNTVVGSVIAIVAVGGPTAAFILARTLDWGMRRPSAETQRLEGPAASPRRATKRPL